MVDLHSHVLAGVDDGAVELADSLAIARAAAADGTRVLAATPHVRADYPTTPEAMQRALDELRRAIQREGIELDVLPGAEIAIEEARARPLSELRRFGLGGNPDYILLETPGTDWPLSLDDVVHNLVARGVTPVIGHPERNAVVQRSAERIAQLVRVGALIQVTAASLDGRLGPAPRRCARRLLDAGLVHLIGSDAHMPSVRAAGLSKARAVVGDEVLAHWLTDELPSAIVQGAPLPPRPSAPRRRSGVLARLRGR